MLKWSVSGREDPDYFCGDICYRVNPIFQDDDEHPSIVRTGSHSSGYGSIYGNTAVHRKQVRRRGSKREGRNNIRGINIQRGVQHWLQPSKDIHEDTSDEYDSIVTDSLLLMTETKKTEPVDKHHEDMDKVIKQLKDALSSSRRLSTLKRAFSRSNRRQRKPLLFGSLRGKTPQNKKLKTEKVNRKIENINNIANSKRNICSPQRSPLLSASHLYNQDYGENNHLYSNIVHSGFSSWSRGGDDQWRDSHDILHDYCHALHYHQRKGRNLGRRHEHIRLLVILCKSFCFVILMVSFIFVIVIVSIFLAKGIHEHI